jgi:hypothetical protein
VLTAAELRHEIEQLEQSKPGYVSERRGDRLAIFPHLWEAPDWCNSSLLSYQTPQDAEEVAAEWKRFFLNALRNALAYHEGRAS